MPNISLSAQAPTEATALVVILQTLDGTRGCTLPFWALADARNGDLWNKVLDNSQQQESPLHLGSQKLLGGLRAAVDSSRSTGT